MRILETPFESAHVIESEPFVDQRGRFARLFCRNALNQIGRELSIAQINHSLTRKKGAIRGMHFQYPPKAETKLIKCLRGSCFDVIVDLRRDADTFLQWFGLVLSADSPKMICIPEGVAHGFQTLADDTELLYLHTEFYSPAHEGGVRYDDPKIGIDWPLAATEVSEKDKALSLITDGYEGIVLT